MAAPTLPHTDRFATLFAEQQAHAPSLARTTARERIAKLDAILDYLDREENKQAILAALGRDLGKPEVESLLTEVHVAYSHVKYVRKQLKRWMEPRKVGTPFSLFGMQSYLYYEPKGSALVISPWNYPFNLAVVPIIYAVAAGCTVILKPSEYSEATSAFLETMCAELFDRREVTVVQGDAEVAKALTALPFDHVYFTGSPAVGKKVMAAAAAHLSSVTLELGGKSPCVVLADVNRKKSARNLCWGKFVNAGQTCIAPDYALVHESILAPYLEEVRAGIEAFYGSPSEASDSLARIVNESHFDRLVGLLKDALQKGARVVAGGAHDRTTRYFAPTILADVTHDMRVMQEEIFGPILPVLSYAELDEAIGVINSLPKPLSFYVQGHERRAIKQLLARTSSGGAVINEFLVGAASASLPFGGVNNSGIGKSFGHAGWLEFTNERGVMERRFFDLSMGYPPYTDKVRKLAEMIYKWE